MILRRLATPARLRPVEATHLARISGARASADAVQQMKNACQLPVAVSGALVPDAHVGLWPPNGGVLATKDAVILTRSVSTLPAA